MSKYSYYLLLCCSLLLTGCQTLEQFSIDYMLPADVSFPASLKRVAIVNNMPEAPDNKLIVDEDSVKDNTEVSRKIDYYNGIPQIAAESLAEALAKENYFHEIVICDSALRTKDITPREATLTINEINKLVKELDVDFLIALENVQIRSVRKINYFREWNINYGTVDATVFPVVKVYLPNRSTPMVTVSNKDNIFWEESGNESYIQARLISEEDLIREASEFAGTIPVKKLLPSWTTAKRYYFTSGSVNMRDAAVYVKEDNWGKAIELWKKTYDTKKGKKKMQAAYNLAVGYEMQDSIVTATEWALKAQAEAREIEQVDKKNLALLNREDLPFFVLTSVYVADLKDRKEGLSRLNMQMQRFKDDF